MTLVTEHLEQRGIRFEVLPHPRAYSAIDEARVLDLPPGEVLKTLVLDIETGHALAVVPSYRRLDIDLVRDAIGDRHAKLASEDEISADFPEFELGAVPALPSLLHVPVVVDPEVLRHTKVTFAAGSQRESVRADSHDLLTGATVTIAPITRPLEGETEEDKEYFAG